MVYMDAKTCMEKLKLVGVLSFATVDSEGNPQIRYNISFFGKRSRSKRITFPENRLYAKIEVFNLCVFYLENDPYFPGIARINIGGETG